MQRKELMKYIAAFAMGDAWVGKQSHQKTCRMQISHVVDNSDYINWKASILSELTDVSIADKKVQGNRRKQLVLRTKTHPVYSKVRERIYTGTYKGLDPHYLKLLDWETLAISFMDDGSISGCKEDKNPVYKLNLCRLSYGDQVLLRETIKDKLGLVFNVHRQSKYYVLSLTRPQATYFEDNIREYILPSFQYKLRSER